MPLTKVAIYYQTWNAEQTDNEWVGTSSDLMLEGIVLENQEFAKDQKVLVQIRDFYDDDDDDWTLSFEWDEQCQFWIGGDSDSFARIDSIN